MVVAQAKQVSVVYFIIFGDVAKFLPNFSSLIILLLLFMRNKTKK
jgi:hypothetical protein